MSYPVIGIILGMVSMPFWIYRIWKAETNCSTKTDDMFFSALFGIMAAIFTGLAWPAAILLASAMGCMLLFKRRTERRKESLQRG